MTNEDKARKMMDAAEEVGKQYDAEGRFKLAALHRNAFAELPVGSLAKLYDIFNKPKGK